MSLQFTKSAPLPVKADCETCERTILLLALLLNNNVATNLQRFTSSCDSSVLLRVTVERRHLGRYMQRETADSQATYFYTM